MGTSTDAYLYYGFSLDEYELEEIYDDETDLDGEEWLCAITEGPKCPTAEYEGNEDLYEHYWDQKREHLKSLDVSVSSHCHSEYRVYFVHIVKTFHRAWRGYPHCFGKELPKSEPSWDGEIKNFCDQTKIPYREPGWELVSMWN